MNGLTGEYADAEGRKGLECTDGEVDRVCVLAGGAVVSDSDGD